MLNIDKLCFVATYIGTFFMYLRIVPIEAETQPIIPCLFLFWQSHLDLTKY